jgi:hypothetical protein
VQKRESCLKEGAGWVERACGGFCKKKKNVLIRERDRYRERERAARKGEEEGVRAKTKPVKMASEKMAPFETVNFRRESILSIHIQM